MAKQLRFDNRVVVITGAGIGLGRSYALEFAKRGAKVVVNDLGCSLTGNGESKIPADKVVEEIKAFGGIAVANYDSAEFGDKIIKTAIDNFGKVDVVINNAGIVKDSSMVKITEQDWDLIMRYHLNTTFSVTRAAWPYMRNQKYGRIINTTSGAGLYGNYGQPSYSSAKLAIYGFTNTISKEGEKYNIQVNTIAPIAASRMTSGIFNEEILGILSTDKIAPIVVYLAHESCQENGSLIEATGGWLGLLRWERGKGAFYPKPFTAEDVESKLADINSFETTDYPKLGVDTLKKVLTLKEESDRLKPKL